MRLLFKKCRVVDSHSKWNGKKVDILIDKGVILQIDKTITPPSKTKIIETKDLHVSPGWMDIGTHLGEPGFEQRESITTLSHAAKAGGYTDLAVMPNAIPYIQTKGQIENLKKKGEEEGMNIYILGGLTKDGKGKEITEMMDMVTQNLGGYSDGLNPRYSAGLLMRALQYALPTGKTIVHYPDNHELSNENLIHEGKISTLLGMKGSPAMAEEIMVMEAIKIRDYTDGKLAIHLISTGKSATTIRQAKKKNPKLFAGVSYLNLIKKDQDLAGYDTHLKVKPVLRSQEDCLSLKKAVQNDVIDYIASNHYPLEVELKKVEYPYAAHGATGLQTTFSGLLTYTNISLETIIKKMTYGPRKVLGIDGHSVEKGAKKLTFFLPNATWTVTENSLFSKSKNSPFIGEKLKGKITATVNEGQVFFLQD